jgi:5'-nucleotidase
MRSIPRFVLSLAFVSVLALSPFALGNAWAQTPTVLVALSELQNGSEVQKTTVHITLLHVNDVYQLRPSGDPELGGMARLATLVKAVKRDNPNTLFILSGDTISPSLASHLFHGKQMIDLWNQLGLDVAVLGNHEFDYGDAVLKQRIQESKFPWLAANVLDHQTGQPIDGLPAYVLKDIEGVKLGFLGLLTTDTAISSYPGPQVDFQDPVETMTALLPKIKQDGADVLIGVTHLPMSEDQRVAAHFPLQLALILGGHEHTLLQSSAGGTPILKMDSDAAQLSRTDLFIDAKTHALQHLDWRVISVDSNVAEDPAIAASVAGYEKQIDQVMGAVLGESDVPLDARQNVIRTGETALGDFIADTYRAALKADVALVNSGGIRSNTRYVPGLITRRVVVNLLPFENPVVRVSVLGSTLKAALETSVSDVRPGVEPGGFLQVSGLRFQYDGRLPVGQRVSRVEIGGHLLEPEKTYTLATSQYLLRGKDGYTMLMQPNLSLLPPIQIDTELLAKAIQAQKHIAPKLDGRIQRLDTPMSNKSK